MKLAYKKGRENSAKNDVINTDKGIANEVRS